MYSSFEGTECKVGYLPKHLAVRADTYARLCARIVEIYSSMSEVTAKTQKYHHNKGCCVAVIIGMENLFDFCFVGERLTDGVVDNV